MKSISVIFSLVFYGLVLNAATDPIAELRRQAAANAASFQRISRTIHLDPPAGDTNVAYEARSTYQQRLDSARNLASATITSNSALRVINSKLYTLATNFYAKSVTFSNACVIAQGLAQAAQSKINTELEDLKSDKEDLEAKIADSKYILLRPWLKVKLAAVEARISRLEALTDAL